MKKLQQILNEKELMKNIKEPINLDDSSFFQTISKFPLLLVDFWAPWCMPCRFTKPILETLAKEYDGRVDFWAVNADEHPDLLRELQIFGIPTLLMTRAGEIIGKYTGAQPRETYRMMFEALTVADETVTVSMSASDRFVRLFAGFTVAALGLTTGTWFLIPVGGAVAFLGLYDRCPIWRVLTANYNKRTP